MAAALIQFSQDTIGTGGNGQAFVGVQGQVATVANSDNTGVGSWQIDLVYSDPSSSIPPATPFAFSNSSSTPSATFTPDVNRSFRFVLKVWTGANRAGNPADVDIRVFTVKEGNTVIVPPSQIWPRPLPPTQSAEPGNKPNEMNFEGQPDGWAGNAAGDGLLNDTLTKLLYASPNVRYVELSTLVPSDKQNGSLTLPYASLQSAFDDIAGSSINTSWVVYVATGHYDGQVLNIPAERKIAVIGDDHSLVDINTGSNFTATWATKGTSYLTFKNVRLYDLEIVTGGSDPPNVATLYLDNASIQIIDTQSGVACDVIVAGSSSYLTSAGVTGRLAVDGADHLGSATCGTLAVYDTLISSNSNINVTAGDGIATNCQINAGVSFTFTGYSAKFYVDTMTKYWIDLHSIEITGATVVVMGASSAADPVPTIYVDINSNATTHDGTISKPFLTITEGMAAAMTLAASGYGEITIVAAPSQYTSEGTLTWSPVSPYPVLNIVSANGGALDTSSVAGTGGRGQVTIDSLTVSGGYVRLVGVSVFLGDTTLDISSTLEAYQSDFNFIGGAIHATCPVRLTECTVNTTSSNTTALFSAIRCNFPDGLNITCSSVRVDLISCRIPSSTNTVTFSGSAGTVNMDDFTYRNWDLVNSSVTNGSITTFGFFGMERQVGPLTTTSTGLQTVGSADLTLFGGSDCQIVGKVWMSSRQTGGSQFGGLIEKTFCVRRVSGTLAFSASGSDVVTAASANPAGTLTLSVSGTALVVQCTPSGTGATKWLGKVHVENVHNIV